MWGHDVQHRGDTTLKKKKKKKKNIDTASKSSTWLSTIDYARLTMFNFALFLKDFKTICSSFSMSLPN